MIGLEAVNMMAGRLPWVTLQGSARQRGLRRGHLIADRIRSRVRREVDSVSRERRKRLLELGSMVERSLARELPEVLDELEGIREGSGVDHEELLIAYVGMRGGALVAEECSCFAASRSATRDGALLLGKQGDIPPLLTEADLIAFDVKPEQGYAYVTIGMCPEQPVQPEGMNEAGLTVVGCGQRPHDGREALASSLPAGASVYDTLAVVYRECRTVDEALTRLSGSPRGYTGRTMIIGDATGDWAKVEIAYDHLEIFRPEQDATYQTNFISAGVTGVFTRPETHPLLPPRSADPDAYRRYDRYLDLLSGTAGQIDVTSAKALFRDHHDGAPGPGTICRHGTPAQLQTFASLIFEPQTRRAHIATGRPCESEYFAVSLFN